jgi:hypothetical protein
MQPILVVSPYRSSGDLHSERTLGRKWDVVEDWRNVASKPRYVDDPVNFSYRRLWGIFQDLLDEM